LQLKYTIVEAAVHRVFDKNARAVTTLGILRTIFELNEMQSIKASRALKT